jgi:hypothetical protein
VLRVKSVVKAWSRCFNRTGPSALASPFARTSTAAHSFSLRGKTHAAHVSRRLDYTMSELQSQDDLIKLDRRYCEASDAPDGSDERVQVVIDALDEVRGCDKGLVTRC